MPLPQEIEISLKSYDKDKGYRRKLLGDHPAIKAVKSLPLNEQGNLLEILKCFLEHPAKSGSLSERVFKDVLFLINPQYDECYINILKLLFQKKVLNDKSFAIIRDFNPSHRNIIAQSISMLKEANLLTQENTAIVLKAHMTKHCAEVLILLRDKGLLSEYTIELTDHIDLPSIISAIRWLNAYKLLTKENFKAALSFNHIFYSVELLKIFAKASSLDQATFDLLVKYDKFDKDQGKIVHVWEIFKYRLSYVYLNSTYNLRQSLSLDSSWLFTLEAWQVVWAKLSNSMLNQLVFNKLLTIAQQDNPAKVAGHYLAQLQSIKSLVSYKQTSPQRSIFTEEEDVTETQFKFDDDFNPNASKKL